MEFVDTHCHIHEATAATGGDQFVQQKWAKAGFSDPEVLINDAVDSGVTRMICVGCTVRDSQMAIELAQTQSRVWASIGIHPHEAKDHLDRGVQEQFAGLVTESKVVAIGEFGLDYYYNHSNKADQLKLLEFQLDLAQRHDLPCIFHVREAYDDFWPVFDRFQGIRGVLHSYTDNLTNLEKALSRGLYIGVNGIATFAKESEKRVMYVTIPQRSLLLETDAPFLTPAPNRSIICQPKHVVCTAEFLAEIRAETLEQLAQATTKNACELFSLH